MNEVYIAQKIQEHKAKLSKSRWKLWSWVVVGSLIVGYLLYASFLSSSDKKALAKLKHEKDLNEELKKQAVVNAKASDIAEKKAAFREEILARTAKADILDKEIEHRRAQKEDTHERISKLRDWNDIDSNVVFHSKSDK